MNPEALFKITYGLYIISSNDGEKLTGHISNTVFQVTAAPPKFTICSHKDNLTTEYIAKSGVFSVSILHQDVSLDFIGHFGFKSGRDFNKFSTIKYKTGQAGCPVVLENAIAYFECNVTGTVDVGTHILFIADVVDAQVLESEHEPLTYSYYRSHIKGLSPKNSPTYISKDKIENVTKPVLSGDKTRYYCSVCGYTYDPDLGDESFGIHPGVAFDNLPHDWTCPVCGVGKDLFLVRDF